MAADQHLLSQRAPSGTGRPFSRDANWPPSWQTAWDFDLLECWGGREDLGHTYSYQVRLEQALMMVRDAKSPPATVLDVAAAQGNFSLALARMGYRVTWNDLREELVGYVQKKEDGIRLKYSPGNIFELDPDELGRFDVVLATEIIEHVAHPDRFLARLKDFLAPDGVIVLTTPNGTYFRNRLPKFSDCPNPSIYESMQFKPDADGHIFLLHIDELSELAASAGLRVVSCTSYNTMLTEGQLKLRHVLPLLPRRVVLACEHASWHLPAALKSRLHSNMAVTLRLVAT